MTNNSGFTLVEMLIVLSVWSILILLATPIVLSSLENIREKHFLETFQHDVLYVQNESLKNYNYMKIIFNDDHYIVTHGYIGGEYAVREIPEGWELKVMTTESISFINNGTIQFPGKIELHTNNNIYTITFPFGKGRGRVDKR